MGGVRGGLFLGHLYGSDLEDFYRNAAFFVLASTWYEGFPMTILETARYGKPMIAPAHGGFPEIIDNEKTGILFNPGDVDDLEKAILKLWNNPQLIKQMGENASKKLETNYSTDPIQKLWSDLLGKVVKSR